MRVIDKPVFRPSICLFSRRGEDPEGFIDTGVEVPDLDPRGYISVSYLKQAASLVGMSTKEQREELEERLDKALATIAEHEQTIAELQHTVESAEWTLERIYKTKLQTKPGPKVTK